MSCHDGYDFDNDNHLKDEHLYFLFPISLLTCSHSPRVRKVSKYMTMRIGSMLKDTTTMQPFHYGRYLSSTDSSPLFVVPGGIAPCMRMISSLILHKKGPFQHQDK